MKKTAKLFALIMALCLLFSLAACGAGKDAADNGGKDAAPQEQETFEWTRQGYYEDENGCVLTVTWMELDDDSGWYVGFMNGENWIDDSYGGMLPLEGKTLRGALSSGGDKGDISVTVSEEGTDGLLLAIDGGETYHFTYIDLPEATIFVSVNTEGLGAVDYAEGEAAPEFDPEYPYQSAQINLAEPTTYTFLATACEDGWNFVKWTKDGADYSTDRQITVELDKSADFIAVFEFDTDYIAKHAGYYSAGRPWLQVEPDGDDSAKVTVHWSGSAAEHIEWTMSGWFDTYSRTVFYLDATRTDRVYADDGELSSETVVYEDGTGRFCFQNDGTITWEDDVDDAGRDLVFEFTPSLRPAGEEEVSYDAVTAMDSADVEAIARTVRDAYLDEDWETVSEHLSYPVIVGGVPLNTTDDFLKYMEDKTIAPGDRDALQNETCENMFLNGQGICLGDGEIWLRDPNYMTNEQPVLEIIALNGIVSR